MEYVVGAVFMSWNVNAFLLGADDILRQRLAVSTPAMPVRETSRLAVHVALFGILYGAAMGSFRGFIAGELWSVVLGQLIYSAVKVPLLLVCTFLVSLPFFFVLNTLFGLRNDFARAVRALAAAQAGLAITLASLAPFTLLWYCSLAGRETYAASILSNALLFGIASLAAQWLVRGYYAPLVARNRRHRGMLWIWIAIYAFVGIQMAWILRPFVGSPGSPLEFFRPEMWQNNAYVVLAQLLWSVLGG
jgi:hypothetical protein